LSKGVAGLSQKQTKDKGKKIKILKKIEFSPL
jgi:hypothetical protein